MWYNIDIGTETKGDSMYREESEYPSLGDAMRYFNDSELNPHDELLKDFKLLLKAHREHINGLSHAEYQEYKARRQKVYLEGTERKGIV